MDDFILMLQDSIGATPVIIALLIGFLYTKGTLPKAVCLGAIAAVVEKLMVLYADPAARGFLAPVTTGGENNIETVLLSCLASALITALFTAFTFKAFSRRRKLKEQSKA